MSQTTLWDPQRAAMLLITLAVIAALSRSRLLWFCWLLIVVGAAPIAFVPPRGVAAYYIPLVGLATFVAVVLVRIREFLVRTRSPIPVLVSQAVFFVILFGVNWKYQMRHQRRFPEHWQQLALVESTAADFKKHKEWFKTGNRVLIVEDAFPDAQWASSFISLVVANDHAIQVDRLVKMEPPPTQADVDQYSTIIGYENGHYVELPGYRLPAARP